jgi:hypothetical protein
VRRSREEKGGEEKKVRKNTKKSFEWNLKLIKSELNLKLI